jgi:hypothetical protein
MQAANLNVWYGSSVASQAPNLLKIHLTGRLQQKRAVELKDKTPLMRGFVLLRAANN